MATEKSKELRLNTRASRDEVDRLDLAATYLKVPKALIIRRSVNRNVDRILQQVKDGVEPTSIQI